MPRVPKKASPLLNEDENTGGVTPATEVTKKVTTSTPKPLQPKGEVVKGVDGETPVVKKNNSVQGLNSDIEVTRLALEKDEKVHFLIPLALGEKAGAHEDVFINGFHTTVPKGVMSILPKSIADILANKYQIESNAGAEFRLDLNPDKQDKIS